MESILINLNKIRNIVLDIENNLKSNVNLIQPKMTNEQNEGVKIFLNDQVKLKLDELNNNKSFDKTDRTMNDVTKSVLAYKKQNVIDNILGRNLYQKSGNSLFTRGSQSSILTSMNLNNNQVQATLATNRDYKYNRNSVESNRTGYLATNRSKHNLKSRRPSYDVNASKPRDLKQISILSVKDYYKPTMEDKHIMNQNNGDYDSYAEINLEYKYQQFLKEEREYEQNALFENLKEQIKTKIGSKKKDLSNLKIDIYYDMKLYEDINEMISIQSLKKFYIPANSDFIQSWNLIITLILVMLIISFPFEQFSEPWINNLDVYVYLNMILEYFFILDIFFNFFTSYRDEYGKLITNNNMIVKNYLETWFLMDCVAAIPTFNIYLIFFYQEATTTSLNLLKLPKYLRIIKGFLNMYKSKIYTSLTILFDSYTNTEQLRLMNLTRHLIYFILVANILACYMISFAQGCVIDNPCENWFMDFMSTEYYTALYTKNSANHEIAEFMRFKYGEEEGLFMYYEDTLNHRKYQIYMDAWYYVIQTVTTVGYGDVGARGSYERLFRSACMMFGVVMFSLLSASIMESIISETMDVYRKNEHADMIEKLQLKYNIRGDSRNYLNLLGNSVYTESIDKELEFVQLLPRQMGMHVLKNIWSVYIHKVEVLKEESLLFFTEFMRLAQFRRCVYEETIGDNEMLSFVYSGQVGVQVLNLQEYLQQEYLWYLGTGSEVGWHLYLHEDAKYNWEYVCIINTEVIEIDPAEFFGLMCFSLKGHQYIYNKIWDYLVDLYMVVSLYYSMMMKGVYFDYTWYHKAVGSLHFNKVDYYVLNKLYLQFEHAESGLKDKKLIKYLDPVEKWFSYVLDSESYKHVYNKARDMISELILDEYYDIEAYNPVKRKPQGVSINCGHRSYHSVNN